jgi:hypothetical protein
MDSVNRAAAVLHRAETDLRGLVSEAAASGDYASVVQIAAWARTVSELVQSAPGLLKPTLPTSQPKPTKTPPATRRTPRPAAEEYPRFFRHGDQLIRIAWSKKEKKEYRHKIPYPVLKALINSMAKIGADGRVFSTDQFLPLRDAEGAEIPSYQAYVGISLMKQMALIDQHGRQGYSIPRLEEFKEAVEAVWQKLPKQ